MSPVDGSLLDDGSYSYDKDIDAQMGMEEEDSVITAFNTFLASSPQVVGELDPDGKKAELVDNPDSGLEVISLDQLQVSYFFGDVGTKGDCTDLEIV